LALTGLKGPVETLFCHCFTGPFQEQYPTRGNSAAKWSISKTVKPVKPLFYTVFLRTWYPMTFQKKPGGHLRYAGTGGPRTCRRWLVGAGWWVGVPGWWGNGGNGGVGV